MYQANWKAKVIKNPTNFPPSNLLQRRKKTMSLHLFMTSRKVVNLHPVLIFLHQCIAQLFHHIWLVMKNKKNITLKMFILERRIMRKQNLKVLMWENMNLSEKLSQKEAMNTVLKQAKSIDHNLKVENWLRVKRLSLLTKNLILQRLQIKRMTTYLKVNIL